MNTDQTRITEEARQTGGFHSVPSVFNPWLKSSWKQWAKAFPAHAPAEAAAYQSPFRVVNKGNATAPAEILIYDQIGRDFWSGEGVAANDFAALLADIDPNADLTIGINSPGGNVWDGLAIHNMLVSRPGKVITRNDGMAASIASVILQAGSERLSHSAAMVMIHRAWGMMIGNAEDAAQFQAELEKHDQVLATLYANRSGKPLAEVTAAMSEETFFTGAEAQAFGLVDTVITGKNEPAPTNNLAAHAVKPGVQNHATGKTPKNAQTMNPEPTPAPAANTPPVLDLSPVIAAINALGDKIQTRPAPELPGAPPLATGSRIEVLGNPLIERYNALAHDKVEQAKLAKGLYREVRAQLLIAAGATGLPNQYDRFEFQNPKIMAANTVDAALANTVLSGEFVTTMRTYIAPWNAFTRRVELSPVSRRQTLEVPLYSSAGSKQQNATNYETGDSVLAPIAVTVAEESKSFHVSRPEANLGLQLAGLVPTNAKVLAEGIHAKMTALMTNANFGADVVIGTAANFDSADLRPILELGKNYDSVRLLLDGGHLAYLLPTSRESFIFGEPGAYGFDGGIFKNNLWTSAAADIAGLVCGPDAIVNAWGMADGLPSGEAISQSTADVNGIPFGVSVWFSRASRAVWSSFQVMHGTAVGDATQAEVLTTV